VPRGVRDGAVLRGAVEPGQPSGRARRRGHRRRGAVRDRLGDARLQPAPAVRQVLRHQRDPDRDPGGGAGRQGRGGAAGSRLAAGEPGRLPALGAAGRASDHAGPAGAGCGAGGAGGRVLVERPPGAGGRVTQCLRRALAGPASIISTWRVNARTSSGCSAPTPMTWRFTSLPRSSRIDSTMVYSNTVSPTGGDSVPSICKGTTLVLSRWIDASS